MCHWFDVGGEHKNDDTSVSERDMFRCVQNQRDNRIKRHTQPITMTHYGACDWADLICVVSANSTGQIAENL